MKLTRRTALALGAAVALPSARAEDPDARQSPRWLGLRARLFGERAIREDTAGEVIALEAPVRAEDAAVVPVAIRAAFAQTPSRHLRAVTLVIDNNPSPVAAVFRFTLDSGRADIETRVRIDEYTFVRAVAETQDGALHMATRFVKASGGCSAPPGKDAVAARATLGRMRLRVQPAAGPAEPPVAQLMISHPNDSGLVMDQSTRLYTPPHFVRTVAVRWGDRLVLSADLDFAISENPHLRFRFAPHGEGELRAEVVDSRELHFTQSLAWRP